MKASVLAKKAVDIAKNYRTLYVMGCFGAPLVGSNVKRYCENHSYNRKQDRTRMIKAAANRTPPVYGFDCVNLIKGILWGWSGNPNGTYGGAKYASNGVPDIGADTAIQKCSGVSTNFSNIAIGEAVWCPGHIGIYIGDGLAVECSPRWDNCVQITACNCSKTGYNRRNWTKHGKMPWVEYDVGADAPEVPAAKPTAPSSGIIVGAVVDFTGNKHYTNAAAASGKPCSPGRAKVTAISRGSKHPYHLVHVSGSKSDVYGWVDAADIAGGDAQISAGCKVTIRAGATYGGLAASRGAKVPSYVSGPNRRYTVQKVDTIKGHTEALLTEIMSWVPVSFLNRA